MGRNKAKEPMSKRERKLQREGQLEYNRPCGSGNDYDIPPTNTYTRRTVFDTRRPAQTSDNSTTWLHAVGFVFLVAVVISWALGY